MSVVCKLIELVWIFRIINSSTPPSPLMQSRWTYRTQTLTTYPSFVVVKRVTLMLPSFVVTFLSPSFPKSKFL